MEKMPFNEAQRAELEAMITGHTPDAIETDWREALPVLTAGGVTLRELRVSDAPSLFAMLTPEEVSRFISPPPTTVEGFERFITWCQHERAAGRYLCFGVVPQGSEHAVGLFQVKALEPQFATAEWGFVLGSQYWGTGMFQEAATLVVEFAFDSLGAHRLEARAAVKNGRGNGALRKFGAVQEGVLRRSFLKGSEYHDQVLWAILDSEWYARRDQEPVIH